MATLVLQAAGSAIGGALGGPAGATIGRAAGSVAGAAIDQALLSSGEGGRVIHGPRLGEAEGLSSTEGAPVPRLYGRARLGGQLIWATRLIEEAQVGRERGVSGGKGGVASGARTVTYAYYANIAVGLCEGPIALVRRVWADGRELDLTGVTMRVHHGGEDQPADPLIVAKEGAQNAPAYRGLAYVVFERLPLAPFGNRVPQLAFEVVRAVPGLNGMIRSVCLIPGAGEFAYEPFAVAQDLGLGSTRSDNRHQLQAPSDAVASLDALQALCPNLRHVSLVVSWFGDDLRAGACSAAPRVEALAKRTDTTVWSVAGLMRAQARAVSLSEGAPAFGGTPSDGSVVRMIRALKARGLAVTLYPFLMMDIPAGNALPNPYADEPGQPAYPWRGRVTCHPAPGRPGSPDGTPAAAVEVAALFGTAAPGDFAVQGDGVTYAGPAEWTLRRQVLHYAHLAQAAGGVAGFVIGSELVGLTRVRSGPGVYPAVQELAALAADAKSVLGAETVVTYAADWTEYGAHVREGGAEVRFPLDPLWAHPAIGAVGIDFYPPLSDWRDGPDNPDAGEARGPADLPYLRRRLTAGEAYDWFYTDGAARAAGERSPITDGTYGKPWIFRPKDVAGWWGSAHVERIGGVETDATAWQPGAKPVWLTEIGIPAVDKGANGPNVFPDPKSAESALPPFSRGTRDDLVQARALEAILGAVDAGAPDFDGVFNPPAVQGRMIDPDRVSLWAWDARPFPAFPDFTGVWADGGNYETGHWLNGRLEGMPLGRLVPALLRDFGIDAPLDVAADGFLDGYVVDRPMSARDALEPLLRLSGVDPSAPAGSLRLRDRGGGPAVMLGADDLVLVDGEPLVRRVRDQESELAAEVQVLFTDADGEYRRASAASRRLSGVNRREARADVALVTRRAEAERLADRLLQELWAGREGVSFALSPRAVDVEPGDVVRLAVDGASQLLRVTRIADGPVRRVEARSIEPVAISGPGPTVTRPPRRPPPVAGRPFAVVLDLPAAAGSPPVLQALALAADPWPGGLTIWRSGNGTGFTPFADAAVPAQIGTTLAPTPPGPLWRWDDAGTIDVAFSAGGATSVSDLDALAGASTFALRGPDGAWEILTAARASLIGPGRYRLSRLLRGLGGSEAAAGRAVPAGALLVRLDAALVPLCDDPADLGRPWRYRVAPAGRDHADPAAIAFEAMPGADALRPLAPVHLRARRTSEGIHLTWTRRTRIGGDAWEAVEVPLGEERELYVVDVLAGGAVVRRFSVDASQLLYPAQAELADFGAVQPELSVAIAQVSAVAGPGAVRAGTLTIL